MAFNIPWEAIQKGASAVTTASQAISAAATQIKGIKTATQPGGTVATTDKSSQGNQSTLMVLLAAMFLLLKR
jgi:Tfp pilus assembly major pilin PilA